MRRILPLVLVLGLGGCIELPKLNVGAGISAVVPNESTLENTYQVDLFARIDVAMLQVEAMVGWRSYEYTPEGLSDGEELTVIPIAVTARYVIGATAAKLVMGGGLVWNVNDLSEAMTTVQNVDSALGYRLLVGANIVLPAGFNLGVEAIYDISKAALDSGTLDELDMSGLIGRVTLAYHF